MRVRRRSTVRKKKKLNMMMMMMKVKMRKKKKKNLQFVTPKRKGKEKILIEEKSEAKEQEDVDAVIEEAINRVTRLKKKPKKSMKELIASMTVEKLVTTTLSSVVIKKTPIKFPVQT